LGAWHPVIWSVTVKNYVVLFDIFLLTAL